MIINSGFFNLVNQIWTPEQFEQYQLQVGKDKDVRIAYTPLANPAKSETTAFSALESWREGIKQGIKHWTGREEDSTSIYALSYALDEIAQHFLQEEAKKIVDISSAPLCTLEQRLNVFEEELHHLQNLEKNLKHHNVAIQHFNERFFFKDSVIGCDDHQAILEKIVERISKLEEEKKVAQEELKKQKDFRIDEFNKLLTKLKMNLDNGLIMDKEVILRSYPQLMEKAREWKLQDQPALMQRLPQLLNHYYVTHLMDKIREEQLPLPLSIQHLFSKLGIYEPDMQQKKIAAGREKLLKKLETYKQEQKLSNSSPEFVGQIQKDFLAIVTNELCSSPLEKAVLQPLIEKLYLFEMETQGLVQKAEQRVHKEIKEEMQAIPMSTENLKKELPIVIEKWNRYFLPSLMPIVLQQLFEQLDFNQIQQAFKNPQQVESCLLSVETTFQHLKKEWNEKKIHKQCHLKGYDVFMRFVEDLDKSKAALWLEKNEHARRFSFNQSQWGDQEILGEGLCNAINYRWIRHLLENPSQVVKSAADLNKGEKKDNTWIQQLLTSPLYQKTRGILSQRKISGVTAKDRMNQAAGSLEYQLGSRGATVGIGHAVLKRDQMDYTLLEENSPKIESLIDAVVNNHPDSLTSPLTRGLFDINAYSNRGGHALGMQIDPSRNLYRFWDVNAGFYQYSSLEKMKISFKEYIEDYCSGEFTSFRVGQYSILL